MLQQRKDSKGQLHDRMQRRVYDMGYIRSLNEPNVELVPDDAVIRAEGNKVYTRRGRELRADVVVLATGFKVRDCESARWKVTTARPDLIPREH